MSIGKSVNPGIVASLHTTSIFHVKHHFRLAPGSGDVIIFYPFRYLPFGPLDIDSAPAKGLPVTISSDMEGVSQVGV